jgi:hypothetical protein
MWELWYCFLAYLTTLHVHYHCRMVNWNGFRRKLSVPSGVAILEFAWIVRNTTKSLSEYPVSWPRFASSTRQDSAAGITTGYRLEGRVVGVRFPVGARFSPLHSIQNGSGAHPASYPVDTGGKAAGA